MRPADEEGLHLGEPTAVDSEHWAELKRRFRADAARADARLHIITSTEERPR